MIMEKNLMVKIFISMTLTSMLLLSTSLSKSEIKNMVLEIKKERIGISLSTLESTENPFIIKVAKKKEVVAEVEGVIPVEVVYTLKAILNKAAFINEKWYKKGDTIGDYKVGHLSSTSVILKSINGNRTLNLENKKKNFIKLNRGYK